MVVPAFAAELAGDGRLPTAECEEACSVAVRGCEIDFGGLIETLEYAGAKFVTSVEPTLQMSDAPVITSREPCEPLFVKPNMFKPSAPLTLVVDERHGEAPLSTQDWHMREVDG